MVAILKESRKENNARPEQDGWVRYGEHTFHEECIEAICDRSGRTDAALIRAFIENGHDCGGIVPELPLNIIDLAPVGGERAWRVLRALENCEQQVLYLAVCDTPDTAQTLLVHPFLQAYVAAQRFAVVVSQPEDMSELLQSVESGNPYVIVAHGVFSRLRNELFACHYGKLLEAWLPARMTKTQAEMAWRAIDISEDSLLAYYATIISSAAVSLPAGALECLQGLIDASGGRYFLLASDAGTNSAAQIRLGALMPSGEKYCVAGGAPVNFHALSHWQSHRGAQVCNSDEGSLMYHLALRDMSCPALADCLPDMQRLRSAREGAQAQVAELAAALGNSLRAEQAFALWRSCDDSPQLLQALASVLIEAAPDVQADLLPQWRNALAGACEQYYPTPQDDGFFRNAASLAINLDAWGLATRLLENSAGLYGATCNDLLLLSRCLEASGRTPSALSVLDIACAEFSRDEMPFVERERVHSRVNEWLTLAWYNTELASDDIVRIEPLGPEHATAFLYQYRDPQIGMMTRLPCFADGDELLAWMVERRTQTTRADFAVMHEEYGFCGVVSANWCGTSAFFHFWMGADFQGAGYGTRAARLLMAQLEALQVHQVFTAAYPDNQRSIYALQQLGFETVEVRALPPEESMVFFCCTLGKHTLPHARRSKMLRDFCVRTQSAFEFADGRLCLCRTGV
ncbi:MAG: hypothetical protein JWN23_2953 [Rhodocyclales bacterium]|nr:hypothetical protein [Rhodocyclales bacterium]